MSSSSVSVNLFDYKDYRQFLRDWSAAAKKRRGGFSLRAFSLRAGFAAPNFFKLITDGHRNLTENSLPKFMKGLGLNKQEQEFFRNLVFFNQAETHEKKDYYYRLLLQSRKFNQLKPLERSQYDFYSTWYIPVVRELLVSRQSDGTAAWVAHHTNPAISVEQAEKAITILERLSLIERTGQGPWRQTDNLVSTGPEVSSVILMNYHRSLLQFSAERLGEIPAPERDVSALTLGMSRERIAELKRMIQNFRQEVLKFISLDDKPDLVVQLDVQMFPVSTAPAGGKEGGPP